MCAHRRSSLYILFLLILFTIVGSAPVSWAKKNEPLSIGSDKQLFLGPWTKDGRDGHLIELMKNVKMTMNPAHVTGERLMVQDKPWEGSGLLDMRQCVIKDGDLFRMYYGALPHHFVVEDPTNSEIGRQYGSLWEKPHQRIVCYAESADGIHWTKPDLGLCEWEGSRENNIIFPNDDFDYVFSEMDGASVFIDPVAKSTEDKYKMIVKISPVGKGGTEDKGPIPAKGTKTLPKGQYAFASGDAMEALHIYGGREVEALLHKQMNLDACKIIFHSIEPNQSMTVGEQLRCYALQANHGSPGYFNYVVQGEGKTTLLGWDTGIWSEATWQAASRFCFDAVFLECTVAGPKRNPIGKGHLDVAGFLTMKQHMIALGLLKKSAPFIAVHIGDNGQLNHEELRKFWMPHGVTVGYDGLLLDI